MNNVIVAGDLDLAEFHDDADLASGQKEARVSRTILLAIDTNGRIAGMPFRR